MDGTAVLTSGELNQSSPALKLFNRPFLSHGIKVPIQLQHRLEWVHRVGIEGLAKRSGGARYAGRLLNGRRTHQGGIGGLGRRGCCRLSRRRRHWRCRAVGRVVDSSERWTPGGSMRRRSCHRCLRRCGRGVVVSRSGRGSLLMPRVCRSARRCGQEWRIGRSSTLAVAERFTILESQLLGGKLLG